MLSPCAALGVVVRVVVVVAGSCASDFVIGLAPALPILARRLFILASVASDGLGSVVAIDEDGVGRSLRTGGMGGGEGSSNETELGRLAAGSSLGVSKFANRDLRCMDKGIRFVAGAGGHGWWDREGEAKAAATGLNLGSFERMVARLNLDGRTWERLM